MMSAEAPQRTALVPGDCLVLKVGSALLTHSSTGLARERIEAWAGQIAQLCDAGIKVVVVSSGAVAEGCVRLGLTERPRRLHRLQAAAAVGQVGLTHAYEQAFAAHKRHAAMVLLTHEDLSNRVRYLNARSTLTTLLDLGVVPIVNENDTVATDEIRFGDNDTLAAMVANLLQAELLLILTNQQGLHTEDPVQDPSAPLLPWVSLADPALDTFAGDSGGEFGRGGMITKVQAARTAANSGARTVIADGLAEQVITRVAAAETLGTLLTDERGRRAARKGWILSQRRTAGEITVDAGAEAALHNRGVSLLPVGAVAVQGEFSRGDLVSVVNESGRALGQGLVNYSSAEVRSLLGHSSAQIVGILGYCNEDELINRDNMALLS